MRTGGATLERGAQDGRSVGVEEAESRKADNRPGATCGIPHTKAETKAVDSAFTVLMVRVKTET